MHTELPTWGALFSVLAELPRDGFVYCVPLSCEAYLKREINKVELASILLFCGRIHGRKLQKRKHAKDRRCSAARRSGADRPFQRSGDAGRHTENQSSVSDCAAVQFEFISRIEENCDLEKTRKAGAAACVLLRSSAIRTYVQS